MPIKCVKFCEKIVYCYLDYSKKERLGRSGEKSAPGIRDSVQRSGGENDPWCIPET